jgi:hypothetical protein
VLEDQPPEQTASASGSGSGSGSGRPRIRRAVGVALGLVVLPVTAVPGSASVVPSAASAPIAVPQDPSIDLDELDRKAAKLAKQYRGSLAELDAARESARKAGREARALNAQLAQARKLVIDIAATNYMNSPDPALTMFTDGDPRTVLDRAGFIQHMARLKGEKVAAINKLATRAQEAQKRADDRVKKAKKLIGELEKNRSKVQNLINRFRPQSPIAGGSGLTQRMITTRNSIDSRFGPFKTIGCLRPGDPGEHGSGRACDFMESFGVMPPADRVAHGDRVAQYAIDNAGRLGVMYIIWKQRIWDTRTGGGWRQMEDRGSITQNHFDHVHISVL